MQLFVKWAAVRATAGMLGVAAVSIVGCAHEPAAENVRHKLFVSSYSGEDCGKCYVVLRYDDLWRDARHSRRVGLIKFRAEPEPTLIDHRWVWGKPVGQDQFVLFDAKRNRTIRRTDYIERKPLDDGTFLAFTTASGRLEIVRADGSVVVPDEAGFTDVQLARSTEQGLELRVGRDGRWETVVLDTPQSSTEPLLSHPPATDLGSIAGTETTPVGGP